MPSRAPQPNPPTIQSLTRCSLLAITEKLTPSKLQDNPHYSFDRARLSKLQLLDDQAKTDPLTAAAPHRGKIRNSTLVLGSTKISGNRRARNRGICRKSTLMRKHNCLPDAHRVFFQFRWQQSQQLSQTCHRAQLRYQPQHRCRLTITILPFTASQQQLQRHQVP